MKNIIIAAVLFLTCASAFAGITGSDPRPPKTGNGIVASAR